MSSTVADLERERRAVMDWLVAARHQTVHSYLPSSETVRDGVLLGYRYLEFRRAGQYTAARAWYQLVLSLAAEAVGSGAGSQRGVRAWPSAVVA